VERSSSPGGLSPEEDRLHVEGFAAIVAGLAAGLGFDEACARLGVADAALRALIVDDFLKVRIAERHFQGGRTVAEVAEELRIPAARVARAREEMLAVVAREAVEAFRQQGGGFPPDESN
jgi:hypothetical protein